MPVREMGDEKARSFPFLCLGCWTGLKIALLTQWLDDSMKKSHLGG